MRPYSSRNNKTRRYGSDSQGNCSQLRRSPSQNFGAPFIRREPQDQDDPTRTPTAISGPMYKSTQIQEVDLRENWYGPSRPGPLEEEPSSYSDHFRAPLKTLETQNNQMRPLRSRVGTHNTASMKKLADRQGAQIRHG